MKKRHEKGVVWIAAIIIVCLALMYFLKNYSPKQDSLETASSNTSDIINDISMRDTTEDGVLNSEQEDVWILFDQLRFEHEDNAYRPIVYAVILICYLVLIGPMTYFFLKKQDKMEWLWGVLPCAAFLFAMIIMMMGDGVTGREPSVDSLTVITPNQNDVVYLSTTSPGRNDYSLEFKEKVKNIIPLYTEGSFELNENNQNKAIYLNPGEVFSRDYIRLDLDHSHKGKLKSNLKKKEGKWSGVLTNGTDWDFSSVLLYDGSHYLVIDDFEKASTVEILGTEWKEVQDIWMGPPHQELSEDMNDARIMLLSYFKYFEIDREDETGVHIAAVIPYYESSVASDVDMVSRGLYYRYIEKK